MGLFDRIGSKKESRKAKAARAKELEGDLAAAAVLYVEAEMPDDAARVLLLRADAEASTEKRIALCALAARTAEDPALRRRGAARKALIAFDVLRGRGAAPPSEMLAVARELEEAGELEKAADAYAIGGDPEGEVRALAAAGLIERLEERLGASAAEARRAAARELAYRRVADLDRTAERREALRLAVAAIAEHDDERLADLVRAIRGRLARGPVVDLEIEGVPLRVALGDAVTVGRGDATIVVASRAVSRRHLRIERSTEGIVAEDLATRNGTLLAGARVAGRIPVGEGIALRLGGAVPCSIVPWTEGDGVVVEVAGERFTAPLGELAVGPWRIRHDPDDGGFVELRTPSGAPRPVLGEFVLAPRVELCVGDEIRAARGGPAIVRVVGGGGGSPGARPGGGRDGRGRRSEGA